MAKRGSDHRRSRAALVLRLFVGALGLVAYLAASASADAGEPYERMLEDLRAEIIRALPPIDEAARQRVVEAEDAEARLDAVKAIPELDALLASDALDAKLAKLYVLQDGTPAGLAAYAGRGAAHRQRIADLLADDALMLQIAVADGAQPVHIHNAVSGLGEYGEAMEIYTAIQQASTKAGEGVLQRLALAVSLELSEPIHAPDPDAPSDAPRAIDPVQRYLHFEQAYEAGELDPSFESLSTWDLRFVVSAKERDEDLAWGREMLRNFRPDHVYTENEPGRYVKIVSTDIPYGSRNVKYDRPELSGMQNILMNGGICGRRSFFARYISRAFGVPATARPSSGHGASAKWSPEGWVVVLGPRWGSGWTTTRYRNDLDFLQNTQARALGDDFLKVKRAWWIGDALGETRRYGERTDEGRAIEFWNGVALATQQRVVDADEAERLEPLGPACEPASGCTRPPRAMGATGAASKFGAEDPVAGAEDPEAGAEDRPVTQDSDDVITLPAAAFTLPSGDTSEVVAMQSFAGGLQVFLPSFNQQKPVLVRGGSWYHEASLNASATRHWNGRRAKHSYHMRGLRLAVMPDGVIEDEWTLELDDGLTMDFVYIPPGSFVMGGDREEQGIALVDVPKHAVTLTQGFYLGKYEVTQAQFEAIMGKNPSGSATGPDHPVDRVKPYDALDFCDRLSEMSGLEVRLPSEAEWEYAARAGTQTRWFFGDDPAELGDYAWFVDNAEGVSHPVGLKKPNPWGLYDLYGNVAEYVRDEHHPDYYANSPELDPTGPLLGIFSSMEYSVEVPTAGTYDLTALVVTKNFDQTIQLSVNGSESVTHLALPFTLGMWGQSAPITVTLRAGENRLHFWRDQAPQAGVALRSFSLWPEGLAPVDPSPAPVHPSPTPPPATPSPDAGSSRIFLPGLRR